MILLPVIYVLAMVLVGYAVYYHTVNHTGILETQVRGRGYFLLILAYVAPIVCGAILLVFMVKPLFFRNAANMRTRSLRRDKEPLLFAFVDKICATVGAPQPKRIDIDCNINASASFRRGWLSMLGSDLVLTIGMPLVAGLNTRQFAGVLAHEFGHFAQGAGMRLTYIIRSISFWLMRVVYQRDSADQWLEQSAGSVDLRIGWVLYLAMFFVWLTRKFLWVLMQIGNIVGSYLLRHMEFDADRYETRLAGSAAFEQTARQLQYLNVAMESAFSDLREFYREGRLADDLPGLVRLKADQLPKEVKSAIDHSIEESTTGLLDTHPADRDRIASAQQEDAEGIFRVELPSSVLFSDFEAQSKATTLEFYREQFGNELEKNKLRPLSELIAKQEQKVAGQESLQRYFQGNWSMGAPLPLKCLEGIADQSPQEALDQLKATREAMIAQHKEVESQFKTVEECMNNITGALHLRYCLRANLKMRLEDPKIKKNPSGWVKQQLFDSERDLAKASRATESYRENAAQRIASALRLRGVPKVAERLPKATNNRPQFETLLSCLKAIDQQMQKLLKINQLFGPLQTLVEQLQAGSKDEALFVILEGLMKDLYPLLNEARNSWKTMDYPYKHSQGRLLLAQYLMDEVPLKDDLQSVYVAASQVIDSAPELYTRIFSDLVSMAEEVETAVGLPLGKVK